MKWIRGLAVPGLATAMLALAITHVMRTSQESTRLPPPVEPPRSLSVSTVAGAGIVEPRSENIAIGAAIAGIVLEVYVPAAEAGKRVRKGDPLFLVDNRHLLAQLQYHEANLRGARSRLARLEALPRLEELPPSAARVAVARARLSMEEDRAHRARRLQSSRTIADEELIQQTLGASVARHQLTEAEAEDSLLRAGAWELDKVVVRAEVAMAEAQVQETLTDLDRARVRAPCDGVVLKVNLREGEYVGTTPGQALMVLGSSTETVHVRVDIDEHDIPRFRQGAPARACLRGNPGLSYPLEFVRIEPYVIPKKSLAGDNTERIDTRVLQVLYALNTTASPIYVGQQVDVFVDVGKQ